MPSRIRLFLGGASSLPPETVIGVGYLIHWMIPAVPLAVAFAIAAIVSPTDPVAVEDRGLLRQAQAVERGAGLFGPEGRLGGVGNPGEGQRDDGR
jgi:hypothetical protein